MEIERKVKEDFEFYVKFLITHRRFPNKEDSKLVQAWIEKLTNDSYPGIGDQYNRNIYLAHLVMCIQKLKLKFPFNEYPTDSDLQNANNVFGAITKEINEPLWLNSVVTHGGDFNIRSKDGRTYLASKVLPNGAGALGYLAVSLADNDSQWLCKNQLHQVGDTQVKNIKQILLQRHNSEERKKILQFYDYLIAENKKILEENKIGDGMEVNDSLKELKEELIVNLKETGEWDKYHDLPEIKLNHKLHSLLQKKLSRKKRMLKECEKYLDGIEVKLSPEPEIETQRLQSDLYKADREAYANKMWEQAINIGPKKKLLNLLTEKYPMFLIKKFLDYLARDKENIAVKLQKRHEHIVLQLKKELQKENCRGKKKCEDAQIALDEIQKILDQFESAANYVKQMEKKREEILRGKISSNDNTYHEIKMALREAQMDVETEADAGRWLSEAIHSINEQNDRYVKINEENILKIDDTNKIIMKNIQKLNKAICLNQRRLQTMKLCKEQENFCKNFIENVTCSKNSSSEIKK